MSETPRGTIYDLGYKRYLGTRRPQATRWRVITRQILADAWKRWWRYKLWIGFAILIAGIVAAIMVYTRTSELGGLSRNGVFVKQIDQMVFGSIDYFTKVAFLLTLTMGIGVVAADMRTGAFSFYFSRPVRPIDYVIGKVAGLSVLHATVILAPMMVIVGTRLGVSENSEELVENLQFVPKTLLIGGLASIMYAAVSLGFSSMMSSTKINLAIWCGYYLIASSIVAGVSAYYGVPEIGCIDPHFALMSLALGLYDVQVGEFELAGTVPALIALFLHIAAGAGFAYWRVTRAAHAGIGAS